MARDQLQGMAQAQWQLSKAIGKIKGNSLAGLIVGALIMERGAKKRTPVRDGFLRASGRTSNNEDRENPEAAVSFGQDYAIVVHENLEARHKSPTGAKYLENAAIEDAQEITDGIVERTKRGLK